TRSDRDWSSDVCSSDLHPHYASGGPAPLSRPVEVRRLDSILVEHRFPHQLGVLSIDTEGWDCEVLLGLDLQTWRPRLIVTEDTRSEERRVGKELRDRRS